MKTVMVWILVISSWQDNKNMAQTFGPYADQESCDKVKTSRSLKSFYGDCIQVKVPLYTLQSEK
ncbi:hypothetical protein [Nitrosomonas sp. Nm166]|uniref:hypothetical protein n=1 Tax=Nitrosomonas sp. Nm166 TaxID=1881054 RepID=UPI0008E1DA83|nr:hypothetical protein [Nitrosomonas sp. Nm166]SFF10464.1 hypothetical protein SAMN05428977_105021 [Nitrosomonas sp. Nm166]